MTFRAIVIGLLVGLVFTVFGYFNTWILKQGKFASDLIPTGVYGFLVLGLLIFGPLLYLFKRRQFKGAEWAVIVTILLMCVIIPGPHVMWHFGQAMIVPLHLEQDRAGWRNEHLLDYLPPAMLPDVRWQDDSSDDKKQDPQVTANNKRFNKVVAGWRQGIEPGKWVSPERVPWSSWAKPLTFWIPLIGLLFIGSVGLLLVVHRQWSQRERLQYPVAVFAAELIRDSESGPLPPLLKNRLFYMGFVPVVLILTVNGLHNYANVGLQIPMFVPLDTLSQKWTSLSQVPRSGGVLTPHIYFAAVGFAYFVSTDVSFSMGISAVLFMAAWLFLKTVGVELAGGRFEGDAHQLQLFGAYLGMGLMIFYAGRRYYWSVLLRAFWIPARDKIDYTVAWGCRIAILSAVAAVLLLTFVAHLYWLVAVLFVLLTSLLFIIVTRINVETGLFLIQPYWYSVGVIMGIFGVVALGPNMLIVLAMLCAALVFDPRVSVMALGANALKLAESENVRAGRLARWMVVALILALVIGVPAIIYIQYCTGAGEQYGYGNMASQWAVELLQKNMNVIKNAGGNVGSSAGICWSAIQPSPRFLWFAGAGLVLVLTVSMLRLRYHWWPIHPVLFLVWGTGAMMALAPSFLLGWAIKKAITKFGGGQSYPKNKPIFIGMVAGEFVAAIIWMIVGLVDYLITGTTGPAFVVHP